MCFSLLERDFLTISLITKNTPHKIPPTTDSNIVWERSEFENILTPNESLLITKKNIHVNEPVTA